jgi:RimJ/RimL family protein N-acetyltransferase
MTDFELNVINDITIETVLKAIINETSKLGFSKLDYIKLVNALLDLSLCKQKTDDLSQKAKEKQIWEQPQLPQTDGQIKIRLFDQDNDYKIVQRWLEDEFGRWFLLSRSYKQDATLDQLIEDKRNILGIITLNANIPIGLMGSLDYDEFHNKAEMRKLIGEAEYREKGFAKEATILWIHYGIKNLKLKKIYLNTIENNIRNVTLNMELGFKIEGMLRKECLIDNKYYDILRMGLAVD